ncbi:MAG: S8 family serine peptidase, partial [Actinomycetota bacterium]|nr:S8 family serine peptidase [Actinomycetota bacterium]
LKGQRAQAEQTIRSRGGRTIEFYEPGNFFIVEAPASDWVATVRNDPGVRYAEPDHIVTADLTPNDPRYVDGTLWGLNKIQAPGAWDQTQGSPTVVVGVIDSGVDYNHPDLATNMWSNAGEVPGDGLDNDGNGYKDDVRGWDCANEDNNPMDDNSHGTHVAGTIGGVGNDSVGVAGVNWDVSIMALKFLNAQGSGYTSDAVQCLDYATRNGVQVTNNSWGGGGYSSSLFDAINRARAANDLFVAAAGNSSRDNDTTPHYPSSYSNDNVISVASTTNTSTDSLSSFSNFGATSVDLGAPGSGIYSTTLNNTYGTKSGTSMATPHVAGAAALVWAYHPTETYASVRNRLFDSVDKTSALTGKVATGGRLNVDRAIAPVDHAPVVTSLSPAGGSEVSGTTTVTATASDDVTVTNVQFFVDGVLIGTDADGSDGYSAAWDTTTYTEDSLHTLTATATDNAGQTGSRTATNVRVNNQPDPPPPPTPVLHVGDLDKSAANTSGNRWRATVTITVHDQGDAPVGDALVAVSWSTGNTGSCTTSSSGTCTVSLTVKRSLPSLTLTVTGVTKSGTTYSSAANHEPDGDSNGTSITVARP